MPFRKPLTKYQRIWPNKTIRGTDFVTIKLCPALDVNGCTTILKLPLIISTSCWRHNTTTMVISSSVAMKSKSNQKRWELNTGACCFQKQQKRNADFFLCPSHSLSFSSFIGAYWRTVWRSSRKNHLHSTIRFAFVPPRKRRAFTRSKMRLVRPLVDFSNVFKCIILADFPGDFYNYDLYCKFALW